MTFEVPGCRVAVVERGPLQGRQQEWNISRKELQELVRAMPCLMHADMARAVKHASALHSSKQNTWLVCVMLPLCRW